MVDPFPLNFVLSNNTKYLYVKVYLNCLSVKIEYSDIRTTLYPKGLFYISK